MKEYSIFLCFLVFLIPVCLIGTEATINDLSRVPKPSIHNTQYIEHDIIIVESNEELISQAEAENWPGNGTEGNPIVISGYHFFAETHALLATDIDIFFEFRDNLIEGVGSNPQCALHLGNVRNGAFINNIVTNAWNGIDLLYSTNCTIVNNTCNDCSHNGIHMQASFGNVVSGNILNNNGNYGLFTEDVSHNKDIINNTASGNTLYGFNLRQVVNSTIRENTAKQNAYGGISISSTTGMIFSDNIIDGNNEDGLIVSSSDYNEFSNNTFSNNTDYGMSVSSSSENNLITWNEFMGNADACPQACDDGQNNTFTYNFWDDCTSPDEDSDYLVDGPYSIDGTAGNSDTKPRVDPDLEPRDPIIVTTTTQTTVQTTISEDNSGSSEPTSNTIPGVSSTSAWFLIPFFVFTSGIWIFRLKRGKNQE